MHTLLVMLLAQTAGFSDTAGVQVSCLENLRGRVGRARVEIVVGAGGLHEEKSEAGIAHLLEHLLLRPLNFDDSNGSTGWGYTSYYRDVSGGELAQATIDLLGAVARLDAAPFAIEKKIVLRELADRNATKEVFDPIFGDTILGRYPGGTAASVEGLTAEQARGFHDRFYVKGNMAVVLRGAVDCAAITTTITPALTAIRDGPAATLPRVKEKEPGPRSFPARPGEFLQGFYWYDSSPEQEVIWRLVSVHLGQRALDELRKERGLTYSPAARFFSRAAGGTIELSVKTDDQSSEVAEWYETTIGALRTDATPQASMAAAIPQVRKALEGDYARTALAAIRAEPTPVEILDELDAAKLRRQLPLLLDPRRAYGTATPESNVGSLIVLGLFGLLVLGALWLVAKRAL